jgi:hypothetical protein
MCWWLLTIYKCWWLLQIINYIYIDAFMVYMHLQHCWVVVTSWSLTCSMVRLDKQCDVIVVGGSMISITTNRFEICSKETRGLELESMGECQKFCSSNLTSFLIIIL